MATVSPVHDLSPVAAPKSRTSIEYGTLLDLVRGVACDSFRRQVTITFQALIGILRLHVLRNQSDPLIYFPGLRRKYLQAT